MLDCVIATFLGISLFGASFLCMTANEEQTNRMTQVLSKDLAAVYEKIVRERAMLYLQGILIGLVFSYFMVKWLRPGKIFHRMMVYFAVTLFTAVIYYMLMPKSEYMLQHLKTKEENERWLSIYRTMQLRYFIGFVLGAFVSIPIAYAYC